MKTNVENIYAGGDVAYAPLFGSDEISAAIGHYSLAHYHGKIAALNICGKTTALNAVPFFWTTLFGKSYRYVGTLYFYIFIFNNKKKIKYIYIIITLQLF